MDYLLCITLVLLFFNQVCALTLNVTQIPSTTFVPTDDNKVQFVCSYTAEPGEDVQIIYWQKVILSSAKTIATFYDPKEQRQATYSSSTLGRSFMQRSTLINPTTGNLEAKIMVGNAECGDTGQYRCLVTYISAQGSQYRYADLNVSIGAPDQGPYTMYPTEFPDLEEGDEIRFIRCYAYARTPTGRIRWWILRYNSNVAVELPKDRSWENIYRYYRCQKYMGSDLMTLNVTKSDNKAIIRCTIDDPSLSAISNPADRPYSQTFAINVFYKVRVPSIRKQPDLNMYKKGTKFLLLECTVDGNPNPASAFNTALNKFTWYYKPSDDENETLATSIPGVYTLKGSLVILNFNENHQGIYICEAQNGFKGQIYSERQETKIKYDVGNVTLSVTRIPSTPYVLAGNNQLQFVCSYAAFFGNNFEAIYWQKEVKSGTFQTLATFYPPKQQQQATFADNTLGESFVNRSTLIHPTEEYSEAKFILDNVECEDAGKYRCTITYIDAQGLQYKTGDITVAVGAPDDVPSTMYPTDLPDLVEGDYRNIRCYADPGTPTGRIRWWIFRNNSNVAVELPATRSWGNLYRYYSCRRYMGSDLTLNFTKDDNQAIIRCTIDDPLLSSISNPANRPHRQTTAINVFYRTRVPSITKQPDMNVFEVGTPFIVLSCTVDANPNPSTTNNSFINKFIWYYKYGANGKEIMAASIPGVYILKGRLVIVSLNNTHQGIYICEARNGFKNQVYSERQDIMVNLGKITDNDGDEVIGNDKSVPDIFGNDTEVIGNDKSVPDIFGNDTDDSLSENNNHNSQLDNSNKLILSIVLSFLGGAITTILVMIGVWFIRKHRSTGKCIASQRKNNVYEDYNAKESKGSVYSDLYQLQNGAYKNHDLQNDTRSGYTEIHPHQRHST